MKAVDVPGLDEFLNTYREISIMPSRGLETTLKGEFIFTAVRDNLPKITDTYDLKIIIPDSFPDEIPTVIELQGKIVRSPENHTYPDGRLCMGSRLHLLKKIAETPDFVGFINNCLIPYLYATSHKKTYGGNFVFGELRHGPAGEIDDYLHLFGLKKPQQVIYALESLGNKKRIANKKQCPCGCGRRIGKCSLHHRLNSFRKIKSRGWFKNFVVELKKNI
jgi:hypothetical protein